MGTFININGQMRELVRVKSDNPTHAGYYTTYRDQMKSEDEEYFENEIKTEHIQSVLDDHPLKPIKHTRSRK